MSSKVPSWAALGHPLILPPRAALPLSPSPHAFPAVAYGFPFSVSRGSTPAEQASLGFLSAFCHPDAASDLSFYPIFQGQAQLLSSRRPS